MKAGKILQTTLFLAIISSSASSQDDPNQNEKPATAEDTKPSKALPPRKDEEWRASMTTFANGVANVAQRATITTSAKLRGEIPTASVSEMPVLHTLTGNGKPFADTLIQGKIDGELGTELRKAFPNGNISWRGIVKAAEIDNTTKSHLITIPFSSEQKTFRLEPLRLTIPFSTLASDRAPEVGSVFAFRAILRYQEESWPNAIDVAYPLPNSEQGETPFIIVKLSDVTPESMDK
jgi:hypothetical protein